MGETADPYPTLYSDAAPFAVLALLKGVNEQHPNDTVERISTPP